MPKDVPSTRPLLDKLGVKPRQRVSVVGVRDDGFRELLRTRVPTFTDGRAAAGSDVIFFEVASVKDLARLPALRDRLVVNGALWVVRPKGEGGFPELEVMAAGKRAGLVDVKVVAFSATHSALKFVIPLALRPKA